MKNPNENRNALIAGLITGALILWLIMSVGCAGVNLDEEGHWPGWIVEPHPPLYGPHTQAEQIELRNQYSDGWQGKRYIASNHPRSRQVYLDGREDRERSLQYE